MVDSNNGMAASGVSPNSIFSSDLLTILILRHSPARAYVSVAMKEILSYFLMHYEFKLADPNVPPVFTFGMARVSHPDLAFLVRTRQL